MMKKTAVIIYISIMIVLPSVPIRAGTWLGSNLVQNGSFETDFSYWGNSEYWDIHQYSNSSNHYAWTLGWSLAQKNLTQSVSVEHGKRYQLYGRSVSRNGYTYIDATAGIGFSGYWINTSNTMSAKSVIGFASGSNCLITLQSQAYVSGGSFDNIKLQQVVYDPQLDIVDSDIFITEDMLDGSLATIGLTLNDLSFADTPTSWYIDWGDGTIENNPLLNFLHQHAYDMSGGAQIFTATLYGINQAGEFSESIQVNIVPEPCSLILICGGCLFLRGKRK